MGSSIDRFLQEAGGPQQKKEPSSIDRWLNRTDEVEQIRRTARKPIEPERAARVIQLQDRTGLPAPVVERNVERIEAERSAPDPEAFARDNPVISGWLAENPNNYAVAQDDLTSLSFLERTWQALKRGRNVGVAESQRGRLGSVAQSRRGDLDEYQTTKLQRLNAEIAEKPEGLGFLNSLVFGSAKVLGQMEDAVPEALASGFAGASAGATAGAILGPGAAGTAALGFAAGVAGGFGKYTFQIEAGNQYLEMSAVRGEDGQPLDENTKQLVASGVGFANALFEVAGASLVARPFVSVAKRFGREVAKDALVRPTMRKAVADFAQAYAVALGGEVGTEFLQEVSGIVGDEIAKYGSEGTFEQLLTSPELREEAVLRLTNIVKETAQGMALLALPGAGVRGGTTAFDARRARKREEYYLALGNGVKESKTFQRLPDAVQQMAERATKDGPIETVYAPVETWVTYWQGQNVDPADVAEQLLGERQSFEQAVATGGDLAIPMSRYATKLAPTDHNAFFAREIRARPNEMNSREAAELLDTEAHATDATAPAEPSATETEIVEGLAEQLVAARPNLYDEKSARTVAETLYGRVFKQLADEMGTTPEALFQRFPVSISGPEQTVPTTRSSKGHEAGGIGGLVQRGMKLFDRLRGEKAVAEFEESTAEVTGDLRPMRGEKRAPVPGAVNPKFKLEIDDDLVSRVADLRNRIAEYGTGAHGSPMWVRETDVGGMVSGGTRIKARLNADERLLSEVRQELADRGWPEADLADLIEERVEQRMTDRQRKLLRGTAQEIEREKALIAAERAERKKLSAEERREARKAERVAAKVFNQSPVPELVRISGTEVAPADVTGEALRKAAQKWALENLRGTSVTNPATPRPIGFNREGIEKATSTKNDIRNRALPAIPAALQRATYVRRETPRPGSGQELGVKAFHHFRAQIALGETVYDADLVVREGQRGDWFYFHTLSTFEPAESPESMNTRTSRVDRSTDGQTGSDGNVSFEQSGEQPRGRIMIGGSAIEIQLLENADLSTFIHETGHFYVELLSQLAADPNATDRIRADWAVLQDWVGAAEGEALTREQNEQIARGFEAYLMTGQAPSTELRATFARFRAWLLRVYRSLDSLQVEITPEVRNVFDRLVASEEEIALAEREQGMGGVAQSMRAAGVPESVVAGIAEAEEAARAAAEEYLASKLIADVEREQSEVYKAERARVLAEVSEEVNDERDSIALSFLMRGTMPDGSPLPPEAEPFKLSKIALKDYEGRYPGLLARLRRFFLYAKEGGADPDTAAEVLGYGSGDELIQALLAAEESPRARIERMVDERMRDSDLNLVTPAELPIEAMKAVHNEKRTQLNRKVLEVLASNDLPTLKDVVRRVSKRIAPSEEVTREAVRIIAGKKVRDLNPLLYQRAEAKAAKAATEAMLRGDIETAFDEKQRETLNHELYRAATAAKEETDGIADYMRAVDRPASRERLGKAGGDYLEQVDELLDRFSFRRVPLKTLDRRRDLREWYDEQVENGFSPVIPSKLLNEAYRTNYKDMTVDELRGVQSTVQSIIHLARVKNRLLANKAAREFAEVRSEILAGIGAHFDLVREPANIVESLGSRLSALGAKGIAQHTRMEFLFDFLDGYAGTGPVWNALFKPFADAETAENAMRKNDAAAMKDIWAAYSPAERRALFTKKVLLAAAETKKMDGNFTKAQILGVALNWGNAYNRDALMEGWGWDEAQVQQILDTLDERDWKTVQAIWDYIGTYWPAIESLEKELNGVAPAKVEAVPVLTKFGELRGGYYPIVFDRSRSIRQTSLDEGSSLRESFGGNFYRAMTRHGHTEARKGTGGKPILLELSALAEHLSQVTHDLSHRRAVVDVWRLLQDEEIQGAIEAAAGRDMYLQLRPWIHAIAGDRAKAYSNVIESVMGHARAGATVVGLGLRVTSSLLQTLGYTMTTKEIGAKYAALGLRDAFGNPARIKAKWEFVTERSPMMADRLSNYDRDVRDYVRRPSALNIGQQHAAWFIFIGYMDMAVSFPSWLGAYRKAMDGAVGGIDKGNELVAIDYADKIVRTTQAAGAAKDMAEIQRGGEAFRLWTMFYSSMSIYFNQFDKSRREFGISKDVPRLVASLALIWFVPSIIEDFIRGNGPDADDDESWLSWLFDARRLAFPLETIVGVRDIVSAIDFSLETGRKDFGGSPALQAGEAIVGTALAAARALDDEKDVTRGNVKDLVQTVGYVTKLPSGQIWRTGEYLHDWMISGDEEPASAIEGAYRAVITGKPR